MRCLLLVAATTLPALLAAQPTRNPTAVSSARLAASLDSVARTVLATGVPGMTMLVARGDRPVYFKSFGLANVDLDAPTTTRAVYHIASITKQFTAAAILRLVEEGKVSLDASVTSYLPELPRQMVPITIRNLLTHTSGLEGVGLTFLPGRNGGRLDYPRGEFVELLFAALSSRPVGPPPGERFSYADVNYTLLALVVERARGTTLWQELRTRFFEPLGMRATAVCDPAVIMKGRASGYELADTGASRLKPAGYISPSAVVGNSGLCSSAGDLLAWQRALVQKRVVKDSSLSLMLRPTVLTSGVPADYAFGIATWNEGISQVRFHTGGGRGFTSFLGYLPATDATIVILVNSNSDILQMGHDVARLVRGDRAPVTLATSRQDLESLVGRYEGGGLSATVRNDAGKLRFDSNGWPSLRFAFAPALRKRGDREFAIPWDPDTHITFLGSSAQADSLRVMWAGRQVLLKRAVLQPDP